MSIVSENGGGGIRCAVTGGRGFIGSHVVDHLKANGCKVLTIDAKGPRQQAIDMLQTARLTQLFEQFRPHYVFHLAAVADARVALADPVAAIQSNIGGTASVLEAARRAQANRVILGSSWWVTDALRATRAVDQSNPATPNGTGHIYTTTKLAAEWLLHDFNALYGLRFTILRYGTAYGPGMWPGLALRSFLDQATAGKPITIFGDGSDLRRLVYVGDLARAHVLALQDVAENQVYELEGLQAVSVGELAELVSRLLGGIPITYQREPSRANQPSRAEKIIPNEKAHRELGWRPDVDLEQGVLETIEWYCREVLHVEGRKNTLPLSVAHRFP